MREAGSRFNPEMISRHNADSGTTARARSENRFVVQGDQFKVVSIHRFSAVRPLLSNSYQASSHRVNGFFPIVQTFFQSTLRHANLFVLARRITGCLYLRPVVEPEVAGDWPHLILLRAAGVPAHLCGWEADWSDEGMTLLNGINGWFAGM